MTGELEASKATTANRGVANDNAIPQPLTYRTKRKYQSTAWIYRFRRKWPEVASH
jgi:hypothetical protein